MREFIREFFGQRFTRVAIAVAIVIFLTMGYYPRARIDARTGGVTQSFSNSWIIDTFRNEGVITKTAHHTHPEEFLGDCNKQPSLCDHVGRRSLTALGFALMGAVFAVAVVETRLTEDDPDNEEQAGF